MSETIDFNRCTSRYDTAKVIFRASQKLLYPIETAGNAIANFHRYANEVGDLKLQRINFVVLVLSLIHI